MIIGTTIPHAEFGDPECCGRRGLGGDVSDRPLVRFARHVLHPDRCNKRLSDEIYVLVDLCGHEGPRLVGHERRGPFFLRFKTLPNFPRRLFLEMNGPVWRGETDRFSETLEMHRAAMRWQTDRQLRDTIPN